MKPPQSFYDFTLQFHQDLDLVYPDWADKPNGRDELYQSFMHNFGNHAVQELIIYFRQLLSDPQIDLGSLWFEESKADWVIPDEGVRLLLEDFLNWEKNAK